MQLALRTTRGRTVIVEPDPASAAGFERAAVALGLTHVTVVNEGAWFEPGSLSLFVDPAHPATNFTEGCVDYDEERLADFQAVSVPVSSLDHIAASLALERVDMVSITTSGAEREIVRGMRQIIQNGLRYLCLARTGTGYDDMVAEFGFKLHSATHRGVDQQPDHQVKDLKKPATTP